MLRAHRSLAVAARIGAARGGKCKAEGIIVTSGFESAENN